MRAAAIRFVEDARSAMVARERFTVALAGGETPRPLYALLTSPEFTAEIDWSKVHLFWGDERCVAPDDSRSNYQMARETLLVGVAIPPDNVHRIVGEADPQSAAGMYEKSLRTFFPGDEPGLDPRFTFDFALLGLGTDGHTASLFPGRPAVFERVRWALADQVEDAAMWRVTLTPVPLNLARDVLFVVSGDAKAARVREVLDGPLAPARLPAQAIRPARGRLSWFVDRLAGAQLQPR